MTAILNIVERAYQGTLEEQDDQALWLVHSLKKAGGDHAILLRGPATAYTVRGQSVGEGAIGGARFGNPARLDRDLENLISAGVTVHAVREDAVERGIDPDAAVPGLKWVGRAEVAGLFEAASRVFAW